MKLKIAYLFIFILVVLFGCSKEEQVDLSSDFTIKKGVATFNSSKSFYQTLDLLDSMSNDNLEKWLVDNKFSNSLYFKMKKMEEGNDFPNDGVSLTPDDIHLRPFIALLNGDGIISIGDTISYITKDIEYVITNGDFSTINKIRKKPNIDYINVIKQYTHPQLKSSWGISQFRPYPYMDNPTLVIEIDRWIDIYFWVHSSHIEVELVHQSNYDNREKMAFCSLSASGEFCSADKYGNCSYATHYTSGTSYNEYQNDRQIYRKTGQSYDFCSRNITGSGAVRRYGNSSNGQPYPLVNYTFEFESDLCADID